MQFLRRKRHTLGIDMAPLIDIVFLLLIFFMLSSSFLRPSLKLDLPNARQKETPKRENLVISIDKNQSLMVNTQKSSLDKLESDVAKAFESLEKRSVHLQGDKDIPYGLFVEVMDKARRAGATQINIVHETS